jgi:hypothetical protein
LSDASAFLHALWDTKPSGTAVQLWRKSDNKNFTFVNFDAAESWVNSNAQTCDVYMAAGLAPKNGAPTKSRATARDIVGISGVWADIDVNGGPESKTGAAPNREAALALAECLAVPTIIVDSGYGIQAWWLFEEVWPFYTEDERDHAAKIVTGFQGALRAEAKKRGYSIDSTFDLARLMRIPGSFNHKGAKEVPVAILDDGGPRHTRSALEEVGKEYQTSKGSSLQLISGEGIQIELKSDASPPLLKLDQLRDIDDEFGIVWEHKTSNKTRTWSMSEYEFSLTNYFVNAGWTDQEICDALVYHRNRFEPSDPKGKNRVDRLSQTIGKVRATTNHRNEQAVAEKDRDEAVDQLAAISSDGGLDPVVTLGLFNRVLGGPEIKELVQFGRDPDTARYVLMLASGDEVALGGIDVVWNQDRFMQRFAVVTRHVAKAVKPAKWKEVLQALLSAATVREDVEDTRSYRAWVWVNEYAERRYSTDKNLACQVNDPFEHNGCIHVPLGPLHQYLRKIHGERIADVDLRQYLEAAGFDRKTINYMKENGSKSTRSYFVAPWERS